MKKNQNNNTTAYRTSHIERTNNPTFEELTNFTSNINNNSKSQPPLSSAINAHLLKRTHTNSPHIERRPAATLVADARLFNLRRRAPRCCDRITMLPLPPLRCAAATKPARDWRRAGCDVITNPQRDRRASHRSAYIHIFLSNFLRTHAHTCTHLRQRSRTNMRAASRADTTATTPVKCDGVKCQSCAYI